MAGSIARMRVALCQINPTVGDLEGNAARIARDAKRAHAEGADLAVFPELALCGYPPRDLLERDRFVHQMREALEGLAVQVPPALAVLVGFVHRAAGSTGRMLHNAAALLRGGRVEQVVHKRLLPTYDVFDEDRYFEPGRGGAPVEVAGVRVGVTVCEDIWNDTDTPMAARRYDDNPVADLRAAGAEVIVNLSASPFTLPKRTARPAMLSEVARRHGLPVVFVNQVGGNDDLLFDGASSVHGADGRLWARLASFEEDFAAVDLAPGGPMRDAPASDEEAALSALTLGVRDYARKCGFRGAVIGLSGGIDSALTAAIAARALGPDQVIGVAMPTRYSSDHSVHDAEALAQNLGMAYRLIAIDGIFQRYVDELTPHLDALAPAAEGDVTFENVQSRIRCAVLMALSNRTGHLLLTTGNKSEMAVGYTTLYGDLGGGLAVISDVPKTFVYRLALEINRVEGREVIPHGTLTKPPSAELREDQRDADSLPSYEVLDAILERFVEGGESADTIVAAGFDAGLVRRVLRMVRQSEYKRRQMPPGLILSRKAFGPGRRYPIAQGYRG
jgi:NAD+ synthase (glutamine-hydrolysing)